jgi:hypothetical protein
MSLEIKSHQLKEIMATYNSDWLLGDLSNLIHAGRERAKDQLGGLSSPQRQLYYLAGLNITTDSTNGLDIMYNPEKWAQIVTLLNEIEGEYSHLFFADKKEDVTPEWLRVRQVAMPSFLSYFNQGPLNYEEQVINWTRDLFSPMDEIIVAATGVDTNEFIQFYDNLDKLKHKNFQAHTTRKDLLRDNWKSYTKIQMGVVDGAPDFIREMGEKDAHLYTFMSDHGIVDRFLPEELVSENMPIDKVKTILQFLVTRRAKTDFLYYTETSPGNPLYERPILDIGNGMYQVFEVKQVIHAISKLLENICTTNQENTTKYVDKKGKLLENRVIELFTKFFGPDIKIFQGYYVDGNEQDILILWKKYAFIIESKGYNMREPFRNPEKAFVRIKDDFNSSIGYGYKQTRRVEEKFIYGRMLRITDKDGNLVEEIDTNNYEQDFSIIVNLESFGQIQCDLATLISLKDDDDVYPWAVKLDDLEIFILTMIAYKKAPKDFIDFLLMRETLHGKLICSDELEICGGFLTGILRQKQVERVNLIKSNPDWGDVFDKQYHKGMGFKNERLLEEKQSGKYIFW